MKYKLINLQTKEETICTKVVVDGFDYYESEKVKVGDNYISSDGRLLIWNNDLEELVESHKQMFNESAKNIPNKVVCCNNPNIDIEQVIDEVEELAYKWVFETNGHKWSNYDDTAGDNYGSFIKGYKTHAETHTLSDNEVVEFANLIHKNYELSGDSGYFITKDCIHKHSAKELLQLFKEQKVKNIYYGNN